MQSLRQCISALTLTNQPARRILNRLPVLSNRTYSDIPIPRPRALTIELDEDTGRKEKSFVKYNSKIYPPIKPGEEPRCGYVCHAKYEIKYSPLKMWYIASFIRGMTVDEAIKQLSFMHKKGAAIVKEAILEAQEEAVKKHNIEFKSNMWIAESFATKSMVIKGIRKHARQRVGIIRYRFCNYYLRLEEGKPPKHYYLPYPKTADELLQEWMKQMRSRNIPNTL